MEPEDALIPIGEAQTGVPEIAPWHPGGVYLGRLAPRSRATMQRVLESVARLVSSGRHGAATFPWTSLQYQHVALLRSRLAETCAPATANLRLAAVRGVLREAFRLGQLDAEDYHRAVDVGLVKAERLPAGRGLDPGEIRALFRACADDPHEANGARNAALLVVLYGCGLRRSEAASLDLEDLNAAEGSLRVRSGKGRRDRLAHIPANGLEIVTRWLALRGQDAGPLLLPVNKGGAIARRRLTAQSIYDTLGRLAKRAAIHSFSPHDLRRSFVSDLLDAGADLAAVQALAGHASPITTARYDRRGERAKRKAADVLVIPALGAGSNR